MILAFLSPFTSSILNDYIPELNNDNIPQGMGGTAVFELVKGLINENIIIHIITLQPGLNTVQVFHNENVYYYLVPRRTKGATRDFWKIERKFILDIFERIKPDVIHANWTYEYSLAALDYNPLKVLITAHDIPFSVLKYSRNIFYFPLYLASHIVYRKAKWISFVSKAVQTYAKPFLNKEANQFVIHNIIDLKDYDLDTEKKQELPINYFLSIGLWGSLKNIKTGLKSFNHYKNNYNRDNYYYVLVGPGLGINDESYKWAKKHKLESNVLFLGKQTRIATLKILKNAKALLHLSKTEAFPMVIGEAMFYNVPVIGGIKSGGVPEILEGGKFGDLVNIYDYIHIADLLQEYSNNGKNKSTFSHVEENLNSSIITRKYLMVYDQILYGL